MLCVAISLPRIGPNVNERYLPSVGNGHLATNVLTDTIFVNNFYNGNEEVEGNMLLSKLHFYIKVKHE